jgi:hypothetical protein
MTELKVKVEKNQAQVTGDIQNFQVVEADGWDLGAPIGNGATLELAIQDFECSYQCKYDQKVKAIIVDQINY